MKAIYLCGVQGNRKYNRVQYNHVQYNRVQYKYGVLKYMKLVNVC